MKLKIISVAALTAGALVSPAGAAGAAAMDRVSGLGLASFYNVDSGESLGPGSVSILGSVPDGANETEGTGRAVLGVSALSTIQPGTISCLHVQGLQATATGTLDDPEQDLRYFRIDVIDYSQERVGADEAAVFLSAAPFAGCGADDGFVPAPIERGNYVVDDS
jgi:hypothetical protein